MKVATQSVSQMLSANNINTYMPTAAHNWNPGFKMDDK